MPDAAVLCDPESRESSSKHRAIGQRATVHRVCGAAGPNTLAIRHAEKTIRPVSAGQGHRSLLPFRAIRS
jgi:hypothetical protein